MLCAWDRVCAIVFPEFHNRFNQDTYRGKTMLISHITLLKTDEHENHLIHLVTQYHLTQYERTL